MIEECLEIPTLGAEVFLYRPDRLAEYPGLVFITDVWGVRPATVRMAKRLAEKGFAVLLPNAFHRVFVQISLLSASANAGVTNLPKQQDIANSVNTSRETVSRALQMLIKSGVLRKVGHQIVIKQAETLKKLAIDGPEAMPVE